jgi:Rieske Fe-S protein
MDRRRFVRVCASSAAILAAGIRVARAGGFTDFPRVRLTDTNGTPLKASQLQGGEAYVFYYPYRGLPCFLIRLGDSASAPEELSADWGTYTWPGGVGKEKKIVSYVAVCSHQLAYPDKASTVIYYSSGPTELVGKSGVIVCCAHASVFDPRAGGKRLHGEATEPIAAVRLEYDPANDGLYATGLAGTQLVERFFKVHRRRLIEEYGAGVYREPVENAAAAIPLSKHTESISAC